MRLTDYIRDQGVTKVSELLGVSHPAVSSWLHLRNLPTDVQKYRIEKLTLGLVSYKEMIEPFIEHNLENGSLDKDDLSI
jgi:predicted transcriptional regulator